MKACLERADAVEKRSNELEVENALLKRQLLQLEDSCSAGNEQKPSKSRGRGDQKSTDDVDLVLKVFMGLQPEEAQIVNLL